MPHDPVKGKLSHNRMRTLLIGVLLGLRLLAGCGDASSDQAAEEQVYVTSVLEQMHGVLIGWDNVRERVGTPGPTTDFVAALTPVGPSFVKLDEDAQKLHVPARFQQVHQQYLIGTAHFRKAGEVAQQMKNGANEALWQQFEDEATSGSVELQKFIEQLDALTKPQAAPTVQSKSVDLPHLYAPVDRYPPAPAFTRYQ